MRRFLALSLCIIASTLLAACSSKSDSTTKSEIESRSYASPASHPPEAITPGATPAPPFTLSNESNVSNGSTNPEQQSGASQSAQVILHVENSKKIPVAVTPDDFYSAQDAVFMNDEVEKVLALVRHGKIFMIENDSSITVLEPSGYLAKIKVKKTGRMGWVKSSWIQPERAHPALNQELLRAARDGQVEAIKSLLNRGADIDVQDDRWGMTPLMYAADGGHVEAVKLLISRGVNLNIEDKSGGTVLSGLGDSMDEQQKAVIRILKRAGAK